MTSIDRVLLRDIGWVLLLKIVALIIIKILFFSEPDAGQQPIDTLLFGQGGAQGQVQ